MKAVFGRFGTGHLDELGHHPRCILFQALQLRALGQSRMRRQAVDLGRGRIGLLIVKLQLQPQPDGALAPAPGCALMTAFTPAPLILRV